ncbi:Alpha/Beta hydrolase protein [Irpex rosettiformis]|uniref:Alpha/Beta hydrolase protein n=1 Tax=Irpex rosettiformis TaxID=378272 RepID=A0ACB8TRI5_9APHY|nr:Alpha/Beta hydrolase protein [Irpex rosettiformis]
MLTITCLIGVGLLYYGQNYLIYPSAFPSGSRTGTFNVANPGQYGLPYVDLELKAEDDTTLRCYLLLQAKHLPQPDAAILPPGTIVDGMSDEELAATRPTIVMFHGNGGNLGHRIPLARVFFSKMRCNVLMMCYRGYGLSEGAPSEKGEFRMITSNLDSHSYNSSINLGIKMDAQAGLDFIRSHPVLSKTSVILYGQSIGGAVSIDLASRNPLAVRALILENTFLSLPRLVPSTLPFLGPFAFLCHQKWDSASKISLIPRKTPILMLSGQRDEVVPCEHMQVLWELVGKRGMGAPVRTTPRKRSNASTTNGSGLSTKEGINTGTTIHVEDSKTLSKFVEFAEGWHNDTCVQPGYWAAVAEFIASIMKADHPDVTVVDVTVVNA